MNTRINAFFSYGFRPFFLLGAIYAVIVVLPWVVHFMDAGGQGIGFGIGTGIPATEWHAHEMLFGYTSAIIAGFFLTAVPSWTKRKPVAGVSLFGLTIVWVLGRLVNWFPDQLPFGVAAVIDGAFIPFLVALVIRALTAGWSKRNLIFLPVFAGLFAANVMVHLEWMGVTSETAAQGHRLALDLVIALIILLGGRVIPAFTTSFLHNRGDVVLPRQSAWMTRLAVLSVVAMVITNQALPDTFASGVVVAFAAMVNGLRLAGWRGHRVLGTPILWVLFLGYGFVVIGLVADAVAILWDWLPRSTADHLLTIGGIGCMTLGIMTRAGLGHTGRQPHATPVMSTAFVALAVAAALRTLGPVLWPEFYVEAMAVVGGLWIAVFAVFSVAFWPILTRPRLGK